MSPSKNYLGAAIPEVKKESSRQSGNEYDAQIAGLQSQIAELVDQMKKQSRKVPLTQRAIRKNRNRKNPKKRWWMS